MIPFWIPAEVNQFYQTFGVSLGYIRYMDTWTDRFTSKACHPSIPAHPPTKIGISYIIPDEPWTSTMSETQEFTLPWSPLQLLKLLPWLGPSSAVHLELRRLPRSLAVCFLWLRPSRFPWSLRDGPVSFLFEVMIFWTRNQPHLKSRFHVLFGVCSLKKSAINFVAHLYLYTGIHIL